MGNAYVPGLKVSPFTVIRLERRLPLKGRTLVSPGQRVGRSDIVASTFLPGNVEMVNVAAKLGIEPGEVPDCMLRKQGDAVKKGEPLASSRGFFGLFKTVVEAPLTGTVESVSELSGQVVLRAPEIPVEINAYADGVVDEILGDEGVAVRAQGAYIQGIFGIGGETFGEISVLTEKPDDIIDVSDITSEMSGHVIVCGALVTEPMLSQAVAAGVSAVVAGGIDDSDLRSFLGYDMGVAVTGSENVGLSLIITEGFGRIPMAERTFSLLKKHSGRIASVSGATQIRAGVVRPEIIIALEEGEIAEDHETLELVPGRGVRLIREPHFGELAKVKELIPDPVVIPTGAKTRAASVVLEDGTELVLPRANLELV